MPEYPQRNTLMAEYPQRTTLMPEYPQRTTLLSDDIVYLHHTNDWLIELTILEKGDGG
jgi:hypothetical protein